MAETGALWQLGATRIAEAVAHGELAAEAVVESCLERCRGVDQRVGAFLEIWDDEARERARDVDRRRAAGGPLGALAGVPVALKDNLCVAGRRVTCASRILDGFHSPYTATAVERLLGADAVLLGKTNLDEFAMGSSCENSALATTRNPWRLDLVPGGSSGGSAAAVAAGMAPLALGSDTGGSIRQPAALCGVVGLKPTYGRVSRYGLVAFASSLDQIGPLARRVADAGLALSVIAGQDPRDATSLPGPPPSPPPATGLEGVRLGVVEEVEGYELAADVTAAWRATLARLEGLGAEIVRVSVPSVTDSIAIYYVLANSEASANLARFDGVRYGRRVTGESLTELYLGSRSEGFGPEVKRRIMLGTFALSSGYSEAYYGRAAAAREALRAELAGVLAHLDALVTPTTPSAAFALGEKVEAPLAMYLSDIFTTPASLSGLPAIAVPAGRDDRGMPLSLQVIAGAGDEETALRVAAAFEEDLLAGCEPAIAPGVEPWPLAGSNGVAGAGEVARER